MSKRRRNRNRNKRESQVLEDWNMLPESKDEPDITGPRAIVKNVTVNVPPVNQDDRELRLRCYEATSPALHGEDRLLEAKSLYAWVNEDVVVVRRMRMRPGRGLDG